MKCCISSGRELSLAHPYKSSDSRDVCKCWMELRLGNASNSSQNPPIAKYFKQVTHSYSFGKHVNFNVWQREMLRWVRESNSPRSGIDFRLGQSQICNTVRECNFRSSGINIRKGKRCVRQFTQFLTSFYSE